MLSGRDDLGESRMREICMSGSTREREAAVFGICASHSVLSSLLYRFNGGDFNAETQRRKDAERTWTGGAGLRRFDRGA